MVGIHRVRLMEKAAIAEGAVAYEFEKPKGFQYVAGQFITLALGKAGDGRCPARPFSLASAPYEKRLLITAWRGTSPFKVSLQALTPGSEAMIRGPFGKFILHEDASKTAVFLAGGIGITPVRSIVLQAAHDKLRHRLLVFCSNRTPETAPFLAELKQTPLPNYTFVATMTRLPKSKQTWAGERGRLNSSLLEKHLSDPAQAIYYPVGSTGFVNTMVEMLTKMDLNLEAVKMEKFG